MNICCLSLLLLILAVDQVNSVALDGDCNLHADCTDANNKCDAVTGTCKFEVGKTCDDTAKCVTGSTCATPTAGGDDVCDDCSVADYTKDDTLLICYIAFGTSCTTANAAACQATSTCDSTSNTCLIDVGESCAGNTAHCATGSICDSGTCKLDFGSSCTTSTDCRDTSTCDVHSNQCLIKVDESCANNGDKCVSGATCTGSTCSCVTDISTEDTNNKVCIPDTGKVGGTCTGGDDTTCDDSNAECPDAGTSANVCTCKTNFVTKPSDLTCVLDFGSSCTTSTDCRDTSTCDVHSNQCLIEVDASCANNGDKCVSGATCTDNTCSCVAGISTEDTNSKVCIPDTGKVGGACTGGDDTTCEDSNAECPATGTSANVCTCKANFVIKPSDLTCENENENENGAAAVGLSAMTLIICITSLLLALP